MHCIEMNAAAYWNECLSCCLLLADVSKAISKSFGVLIDNEADPDFGVALRATAIVDPKGKQRSVGKT